LFTVRCTAKLIRRIPSVAPEIERSPSTALGDWYGNLLNVGHSRLILFTSEASLLSLIVPARDITSMVVRLIEALAVLLAVGGVDQPLIDAEIRQMAEYQIGRTRSRSVLASINDMAFHGRSFIELHPSWTLLDVECRLAIMPCGPLGMKCPGQTAAEKLMARHAKWG
jgi:hypothetical protein